MAAPPVRHAGVEVAVYSLPAERVGGDFVTLLPWGSRLLVAVGDVMGKGLKAATQAKKLRHSLQSSISTSYSLEEVMDQVGKNSGHLYQAGSFATLCLVCYEQPSGRLTCLSAGHFPPMVKSNGNTRLLEARGTALGLFNNYQQPYPQQIILGPKDVVVLYTDGLVEARNTSGERFGLQRLRKTLENCANLKPRVLIQTIINNLNLFTGCEKQKDDVTLLVLQIT